MNQWFRNDYRGMIDDMYEISHLQFDFFAGDSRIKKEVGNKKRTPHISVESSFDLGIVMERRLV